MLTSWKYILNKYIKKILIYGLVGVIFFYAINTYNDYKRKEELKNLLIKMYKEKNRLKLTDTLVLCEGLLITNPSKENIKTCEEIKRQLD